MGKRDVMAAVEFSAACFVGGRAEWIDLDNGRPSERYSRWLALVPVTGELLADATALLRHAEKKLDQMVCRWSRVTYVVVEEIADDDGNSMHCVTVEWWKRRHG